MFEPPQLPPIPELFPVPALAVNAASELDFLRQQRPVPPLLAGSTHQLVQLLAGLVRQHRHDHHLFYLTGPLYALHRPDDQHAGLGHTLAWLEPLLERLAAVQTGDLPLLPPTPAQELQELIQACLQLSRHAGLHTHATVNY